MGLLTGKKVLIFGVANEMSIAWGIAQEFKKQGAQIALSYIGEAIKKRVEPLAKEVGADFIFPLDAGDDADYEKLPEMIKDKWGTFDVIVHSMAFADRKDLKQAFYKTSRAGYALACDISAYSLVGLTQNLLPVMNKGGSIMAMSYYGSQKVITNYNVMGVAKAALESTTRYLANEMGEFGITVNCISAGPMKTLASSGIAGFRELYKQVDSKAPLRRTTTHADVAGTALFLASDLSSGVTGQVIYVDCGLSILGGF